MDALAASVLARLLLPPPADGPAGATTSLADQLLPRTVVVECADADQLGSWVRDLRCAVANASPGAVVALLDVHAPPPKPAAARDPHARPDVAPLGCRAHPKEAIETAAAASPGVSAWFNDAAAARFTGGAPLLVGALEPELQWETPYAGKAVSPADALPTLLAALGCPDCQYAGFTPPAATGGGAQVGEPGDGGGDACAPPAEVAVRRGTAPVCALLAVTQPALLPHAALRALRCLGGGPVGVLASPPPAADDPPPRLLDLLRQALIPVRRGRTDGSGAAGGGWFSVDLWARLMPRAGDSDAGGAVPLPPAAAAAPPPPEAPAWPGVAGYASLRRALDDAVVAPLAAARVRAVAAGPGGAPGAPDAPPSAPAANADADAALARLAAAMRALRVEPPRGLLLHGPSGCGKTAWATALAAAAGLRLLHVSCPRLPSRYVGDSEAGVRAVFRAARAAAPCLLLLDDIHSIAGVRLGAGARGAAAGVADGRSRGLGVGDEGQTGGGGEEGGSSDDGSGHDDDNEADGSDATADDLDGSVDDGASAAFRSHLPDSLGAPPGGGGGGGGTSVLDRMLATLLNEMDGVGLRRGERGAQPPPVDGGGADDHPLAGYVLVVGTTDTPGRLDPAVTRPGRLERHLRVGPLEHPADAEAVLRLAARGVALGDDVDLPALAAALLQARQGSGPTPAEVAHAVAAAALAALQEATGTSFDAFDAAQRREAGGGGAAPSEGDEEDDPAALLCVSARHLRAALGLPAA